MGLISGILGLPIAPLRGTIAIAEQVLRQAEETYYDPAVIRQQLDEIEQLRAAGALDEDEAAAQEDELIGRMIEGAQRERD